MSYIPKQGAGSRLNRIHDILASPTRRALLELLRETEATTVAALAANLGETDEIQREHPERIETRLHHVYLPKMGAADLITYDRSAGTVRTSDAAEAAYRISDRGGVGE